MGKEGGEVGVGVGREEEIKHTSISTPDQISESDGSAAVSTGDQGITVTRGGERDDGGGDTVKTGWGGGERGGGWMGEKEGVGTGARVGRE